MSEIQQQINRLRDEIRRHDRLYYVEVAPEISDREYDRLMDSLKELESANPELITPDSPTQRVAGQPIDGFRTVDHQVPMLSIDNTYDRQQLERFDRQVREKLGDQDYTYTVSPKIDGVAASLEYELGQLVLATTRGDGHRGDDITSNARTIKSIPLALPRKKVPERLEIRGEVYWPLSDFGEYNRRIAGEGREPLANPRNGTAGTLKLLDPRIVALRKLAFMAHGFGEVSTLPSTTESELFDLFRVWGIPVNRHSVECKDINDVWKAVCHWDEVRNTVDYDTDGVVVKVNELKLRETLGNTSKYPRWCIAYKFETERAETVIREVSFQVGRTGVITPVAHLEPVPVAGTTVSRASMHNFDQVERLGIHTGDRVIIEKAGEIIPQVVRVMPEHRPPNAEPVLPPEDCPECGSILIRDEGGVYLRCANRSCPAQLKESIVFYAGRNQMDIDTLGVELVAQLVDCGLVNHITDLYELTPQEVAQLPRMGDVSAANLINGINDSKNRGLARVLAALGIRHVGGRGAEILADHFGDIDLIMQASVDDLVSIRDIGRKIAEAVYDYFHSGEGLSTVEKLRAAGVVMTQELKKPADSGPLNGMAIVVTGTLENYSRAEIRNAIKAAGGNFTSSVSKNTDLVVAGESPGASKIQKADELGIKRMSGAEFVQMLEKNYTAGDSGNQDTDSAEQRTLF